MVNLISNSIKFTPSHGKIDLNGYIDDEGNFVIKISDNGVGMTEDELNAAKEKFIQVGNDMEAQNQGAGLGLRITIGLIESHGGSMHMESEPGIGTTILSVLPKSRLSILGNQL